MAKKRVLVLNGSFCEAPIIKKAKEMGMYVITTGNASNLIGHQYADEYIPADYSDKEKVLQIVKDNDIEGVISCANDFGVLTAAYVAEQMGWPGHDKYEIAKLLHHKNLFKQYVYKHNIPAPHSYCPEDKADALNYIKQIEYPIIVKANDLTGGKGIRRANTYEEAVEAVDYSYEKSRDKHIVIEPFVIGTQHTYVTFLINKKVYVSTSCNCYSPINPHLIQSETLPADCIERVEPELKMIIENMAEDLNLVDGIIALQYIMKDGKPYIIETMRRAFGNQFLMLADKTTGFPWEEAYIKAALGESCDRLEFTDIEYKYCGHHGIMAPHNGKIRRYEIDNSISPHIFKKIDMLGENGAINDYLNERIAYIYYQYENKEEMINAVKNYNNNIKVIFADE